MRKFFKYTLWFFFILFLLAAITAAGGLYYLVVVEPGPEIEEEYINSILGRESPVFYRDGETKIGVLFEDYHRQYVPFDSIPKDFVYAIVAAEDGHFFSHYGIDITGIGRAMLANIKAGRVVQGGSTLTQQAAKNLFKRESRSYRAKLKELLYALRLEHRYSKEKILEFYCNQFFVSGNGHGLGVAARYYFDKDVSELNLLECAFIAGSVQRPNYYNPFTKHNQAHPEEARKKVDKRVRYVLGQMLENGTITREAYDRVIATDVAFNKGKMRFRVNTAMDLVKDGLSSSVVTQALRQHGISNVSTSGIRVYTSLDKALNQKALEALRQQLSYLGIRLEGYDRTSVQTEYEELKYSGDKEFLPGAFMFGEIVDAPLPDDGVVWVSLSDDERALLDQSGLDEALDAYVMHVRGRWQKATARDRKQLIGQLVAGDSIYVRLREQNDDGTWLVDLEKYPSVEGGAMVLQKGMIRAMAGGMTDQYFNRAVDAKRLMGSTFKPFLFAAAMQLGWSSVDLLDNRRDVFVFMDRPYFPRPDHHSDHDFVSMSWAGVKSENVAAVWLVYHLLDHVSLPGLREMAQHLDMAPRIQDGKSESYEQFRNRIRDHYGIVMNNDTFYRAAFEKAKRSLRADFYFDGRIEDYQRLLRIHDGVSFGQYQESLRTAMGRKRAGASERAELSLRLGLLHLNYASLDQVRIRLEQYRSFIEAKIRLHDSFLPDYSQPLPSRPEGFLVRDGSGRVHYTLRSPLPDDWNIVSIDRIVEYVGSLDRQQQERFWQRIQLEESVTYESLVQFTNQIAVEESALRNKRAYSLEVLSEVRDYRVMLGLRYLISLARQSGIESELEPVLSFPLGSNVITLFEATRMYETIITGKRYQVGAAAEMTEQLAGESGSAPGKAIIERIEAPDGEVIYAYNGESRSVFDEKVAMGITDILYNTVRYGTGRYASDHVRLHSDNIDREQELEALDVPVPLLGKTGTANRYRNAAFLGGVPVLTGANSSHLTVDEGYTIGVYIGYDENASMVRKNNRISGSQGALPAWSAIADAVLQIEATGDKVDPIDLSFNGLNLQYSNSGQVFVVVDPDAGGKPVDGASPFQGNLAPQVPSCLAYGHATLDGHFEPKRFFLPYWKNTP
ncbi:transglycosylase domain-containing protein [Desulfogranum japonicum]|uniref:transglycosylase domain-containing protein n=1 Tax=Desulfogranum japonicum TaxID=231447 RepID=UPI00040266BA|nr:transglycosylase domain-containing protein [Desulfogranum japonicum]